MLWVGIGLGFSTNIITTNALVSSDSHFLYSSDGHLLLGAL